MYIGSFPLSVGQTAGDAVFPHWSIVVVRVHHDRLTAKALNFEEASLPTRTFSFLLLFIFSFSDEATHEGTLD